MDEKKTTKVGISTLFLIFAILVIIVMGWFIYKLNNEKSLETKRAQELQSQVNNLNETVGQLQGKLDTISNTIASDTFTTNNNSNKELTENEKRELFNKAIKEQMVLIDDMILTKDFSQKNFTDKEIILLLPDSSEGKIFSSFDEDYNKKSSITDIEKSAKKLFDRNIDINKVEQDDDIKIINNNVVVAARTGVGVLDAELISIETVNNNEYTIKFKFSSGSGTTETYKLTVNYNNGSIIYKSFEK